MPYLIVSSKETIKSAYNTNMASMLQLMLSLRLNATLALAVKKGLRVASLNKQR
jgi:hypothetical protein